MLRARIDYADLRAPAALSGGGVVFGGSRIEPVAHRMLRTRIDEAHDRICVTVYERVAGEPSDLEWSNAPRRGGERSGAWSRPRHPLDWGRLTVDRGGGRLTYEASDLSAVPVYVRLRGGGVDMDWDYARLLDGADVEVDWPACLAHLGGAAPYSARTMVAGLSRSTAGAILHMGPEGVTATPPAATVFEAPRDLLPGADPTPLLFEAVKAQIEVRPLERARTAVEISGGMDSALTALATAEALGPGVMSLGAQFPGAMGEAQRRRRRILVERGRFDDVQLPAERFAPFAPNGPRRRRFGVFPQDETYPEIFDAAFALLARAGVDVLVSGFGGDELYPAFVGEEADDAGSDAPGLSAAAFLTPAGRRLGADALAPYPPGPLQETCWRAAAGRAQRLLKHGIWPVYPYHSIELAAFVRRLPYAYRRDRTLLRQALAARLGPEAFPAGYLKETFEGVALRGIVENRGHLRDLLGRSRITRSDHVDGRAALAALNGPVETLDRARFNALYALLSTCSFFD